MPGIVRMTARTVVDKATGKPLGEPEALTIPAPPTTTTATVISWVMVPTPWLSATASAGCPP